MNYSKWKISERSYEIPAALLAEGILNLHMAITAVKIIHTQLPEQFENADGKEC